MGCQRGGYLTTMEDTNCPAILPEIEHQSIKSFWHNIFQSAQQPPVHQIRNNKGEDL